MFARLAAKPALAIAATLSLAACQTASSPDVARVAASGVPVLIGHWADLNPDCTPTGPITLRVVRQPEHGEVTIRERSGYTFFAKDNPRFVCNARATPGVDVTYVSRSGYVGADSLTLEVIFTEGGQRQPTFAINVR